MYRRIQNPLLGKDRETNNKTTAVATQRHARNSGSTVRPRAHQGNWQPQFP
jgi:hypothetical protein